jgi:hypothetical protein
MKRFLPILTLLLLSFSSSDPVPLADKPGTWSYSFLNDANTKMYAEKFTMKPGELETFRQKLDRIVNDLHRNPVMADPKGIDPMAESRPLYPAEFEKHSQNYGYVGEINFRMCPWFSNNGKVYKVTIEPPRVSMYINRIMPLMKSAFNVAGPEDPAVRKAEILANEICKPEKIKELGPGVTLYDDDIVISDPKRQLYLPCSVEEAFKRLIAYYELAAKKEPAFGVMLTGIKQELTGLTAAQLKSPAYFGGMFSGITPQPNNDPLYLFNDNYFDRSKSKTAVQLVTIPIDADYFRKESDFVKTDLGFLRIYQFLHSLDIEAMQRWIE